jgi:hypothetical protein
MTVLEAIIEEMDRLVVKVQKVQPTFGFFQLKVFLSIFIKNNT